MDDLQILDLIRRVYLSSENYDGNLSFHALIRQGGVDWLAQAPKINKSKDGKKIDVTFSFNVHDKKEVEKRIKEVEKQWFIDETI